MSLVATVCVWGGGGGGWESAGGACEKRGQIIECYALPEFEGDKHLTPASSEWSQLCTPSPL